MYNLRAAFIDYSVESCWIRKVEVYPQSFPKSFDFLRRLWSPAYAWA